MIQAHRADDCNISRNDISRVQESANPYLNQGYVHFLLLEIEKGNQGQNFKIGQLVMTFDQFLLHLLHLLTQTDKISRGNRLTVDTNPIMNTNHVGRGKTPCLATMPRKQLTHEGNSRAFAICTSYMNRWKTLLRISKKSYSPLHPP